LRRFIARSADLDLEPAMMGQQYGDQAFSVSSGSMNVSRSALPYREQKSTTEFLEVRQVARLRNEAIEFVKP
jgi:hypothetical protein